MSKKILKTKIKSVEAAAARRCPPPPPTQPPEEAAVPDADSPPGPSASGTAASSAGAQKRPRKARRPTTEAEKAAARARQQKCRNKDREERTHPCDGCFLVCASKAALSQHLSKVHRIMRLDEERWQEVIRGVPKE